MFSRWKNHVLMPTSWPSLITEPSGLMMTQVLLGKCSLVLPMPRKRSVVKCCTKTRLKGNFGFCLFIPSPSLEYTSQLFFFNDIGPFMTSFSVAKAYIPSGAAFWISKYIQVLWVGEDREMSFSWSGWQGNRIKRVSKPIPVCLPGKGRD